MEKTVQYKLTKWEKNGDHPLVTINNKITEYEYIEAAFEGAGFIDKWIIVNPGSYILEINNQFVCVLSEKKAINIFKSI